MGGRPVQAAGVPNLMLRPVVVAEAVGRTTLARTGREADRPGWEADPIVDARRRTEGTAVLARKPLLGRAQRLRRSDALGLWWVPAGAGRRG